MPPDNPANLPPGVRYVRLFRNGRNQALRIPREFELEGEEAMIRREGDALLVTPLRPKSLLGALARLERLEESFVLVEDGRPDAVEV